MTFSEDFFNAHTDTEFPYFIELICENSYEEDNNYLQNDFYYNKYKELIVSKKALDVIKQHIIDMCDIEEVT